MIATSTFLVIPDFPETKLRYFIRHSAQGGRDHLSPAELPSWKNALPAGMPALLSARLRRRKLASPDRNQHPMGIVIAENTQ